jgi:hypothetical protein
MAFAGRLKISQESICFTHWLQKLSSGCSPLLEEHSTILAAPLLEEHSTILKFGFPNPE